MIDFFQTLNVKRFIFADGDNVNNPKVFIDYLIQQNYLELNTQVICFIGANTNQNNWYNTAVKYIQSLDKKTAFNITPIRIVTEGSNALDMVLNSYVGLAMGQNPAAEFIIVSNDKGYDSVVNHFGSLGVSIERKTINLMGNDKISVNFSVPIIQNFVESILRIKTIRRPKSLKTYNNLIKNIGVDNKRAGEYSQAVLDKLVIMKKAEVHGQNIVWK